jgi:hypothetical protein
MKGAGFLIAPTNPKPYAQCVRDYRGGGGTFEPMTISECYCRIDELKLLGRDWDSYDAEAPNFIALSRLKRCVAIAETLGMQPRTLVPSPEGGAAYVAACGRVSADIEFFNVGDVAAITAVGGKMDVWELAVEPDLDAEIEASLVKIDAFLKANGVR